MTYSLALSVSIAGPRDQLLQQERWPLAMRLVVAYPEDGGDDEERTRMLRDALRQQFSLGEREPVEVVVRSNTGTRREVINALSPDALAATEFVDALKVSVIGRAQRHAAVLDLAFDPERVAEFDDTEEADSEQPRRPWGALAQTLSSLPSAVSGALRATWFTQIERDWIADLQADGSYALKPGVKLCCSLKQFAGVELTYEPDRSSDIGIFVGAERHGACNWLSLAPELDPALATLQTYWQEVRAADLDSLEQLDRWLLEALDGKQFLSFLGKADVERWIQNDPVHARPNFDDVLRKASSVFDAQHDLHAVFAALSKIAPGESARAVLRASLADRLRHRFAQTIAPLQLALEPARLGDYCLDTVPEPDASARACLPGEGIALCLGAEATRLLHVDGSADDDAANALRSSANEIAGALLFGRRASSSDRIGATPWNILTAAKLSLSVPAVEAGTALPRRFDSPDQPTPLTLVYENGVLRGDQSYRGESLIATSLLQGVHRQSFDNPEMAAGFRLADLGFGHAGHAVAKALPLRYGDHYEFASSLVDRSGCHAKALVNGASWQFDFDRVATLQPPLSAAIRYQRRVAVGECNLTPSDPRGWPALPADVVLACRESSAAKDNAPTVLLVPRNADGQPSPFRSERALTDFSFDISKPRVDEQTWLRWSVPRTDLDEAAKAAAVAAIRTQLVSIYSARDAIMASAAASRDEQIGAARYLPFDPAVVAIAVRATFSDSRSVVHVVAADAIHFVAEVSDESQSDGTRLRLRPGDWAQIEFLPLVSAAEFDQRFHAEAMDALVEDEPIVDSGGNRYRAFSACPVYLECASADLPAAADVYERLRLRGLDNHDVEIVLADAAHLAHFDRVIAATISSERWIWRNRPIPWLSAADATAIDSRPPPSLYVTEQRDRDPLLDRFDDLATLDQGFVGRARVTRGIVRGLRAEAGMSGDDCLLYRDVRDQQTPADYLHYGLTLKSRYAGVLAHGYSERTALSAADGRWFRRIALEYRGDVLRIPVPRVLAVLPLTRKLGHDPRAVADATNTTPFLVILDETAYREFGIGERLEARVSLVKAEIGDEPAMPRPFRIGALPDQHMSAGPFADQSATEDEEALQPELALESFGPFGFSLDRSDDQALANASAWVVFAPANTPPHFNLFVEFRRHLRAARDIGSSPWSEALPLYTLASSTDLVASPDAALTIDARRQISAQALRLRPHPDAEVTRPAYRYALLLGNRVSDGGRGVLVFVPRDFAWLSTAAGANLHALTAAAGQNGNDWPQHTHGVLVEILLNGLYVEPGNGNPTSAPLDRSSGLRDLFKRLLSTERVKFGTSEFPSDAQGMILRASDVVALDWQT